MNIQEIMKLLPHRYPFLLIDRVTEVVPGESATGIKNVSMNEFYFQGHFPGNPIVPGVLIVESLAQLTAVMYCAKNLQDTGKSVEVVDGADIAGKVGYLIEIRNMKFKQIVVPGDQMVLKVRKKVQLGSLMQVAVSAYVDGKEAVCGIISVSERE